MREELIHVQFQNLGKNLISLTIQIFIKDFYLALH